MYVFDLLKTAEARGRARYELISKPSDSNATPALERSKAVVNRVVSKDLNWRPGAYPSDRASCPINKHLCRACCRIFQGTGIEAINLLKTDINGVFLEHLDCYFLEKSACSGCHMCAIVWNSHRPVKELLIRGEQIPMRYDYGEFLGTDTLYAVKFYPFALLESNGRMMPAITVTLDRATEELSRSMTDNKLPTCKVQGGNISTGSSDSMSQIAKWLERCKCCAPREPSKEGHFVPDRLVDADASYPDKIRIVNGINIAGCSNYLALSHCWGHIEAIRGLDCQLVTSRIDEFMEGIPLQRLPMTFSNAVSVARTLGIRYIWIDCLCIVQDSKEDWQHNAGLISKIYASSYLTLAATASRSSTEGLFRTPYGLRCLQVLWKWQRDTPSSPVASTGAMMKLSGMLALIPHRSTCALGSFRNGFCRPGLCTLLRISCILSALSSGHRSDLRTVSRKGFLYRLIEIFCHESWVIQPPITCSQTGIRLFLYTLLWL